MKAHHDKAMWGEAAMDTPLTFKRASSPSEQATIPGCHLKSWERANGWPKFYGILVKYGGDPLSWTDAEVVVRSKDMSVESEDLVVWTGTIEEYHSMWDCD